MRLVWKCDFCREIFETDKRNACIKHEEKCSFNPANKKCITCKHRDVSGPWEYQVEECRKNSSGFMYDVQEGDAECPDWESK